LRDLWQEIVLGVVGTVLFGLATKLLMGKRRVPARPGRGGGMMRYPLFVLFMSVFAVLVGLTALVVNGVAAFEKDPFSSVFVFIGFPVAGTLCATMYFRVRYALVPGGMRCQPMWRRKSSLSWAEVTRLRFLYPSHQRYFCIDTAGDKPVKLSLMLTGLPEFARTVLAQVPAAAIDDETRYALEQLKAGFLPPEV
jgi:hypothetical protein